MKEWEAIPLAPARRGPVHPEFRNPDAFVRKKRRGKSECTVCNREFASEEEARDHVDTLMRAGAFGDHMQIHGPDPFQGRSGGTPPFAAFARETREQTDEPESWRARLWRFW